MESTVELKFCHETLGVILEGASQPLRSILIVDLACTGRAATVWLGHALEILSSQEPQPQVTLALPGTRWAGRGQLLTRHLETASASAELDALLLWGPAGIERSAPVDNEIEVIREGFDLIIVLAIGGAAGLGAPWPEHPAQRWLALADASVFGSIDPDSIVGDLLRYQTADPSPVRLRVETLDGEEPHLVGRVDIDDVENARRELPLLIETARRHPWRIVVQPPPGVGGSTLACPSETAARAMIKPLKLRRSLVAGRLRLVAGEA